MENLETTGSLFFILKEIDWEAVKNHIDGAIIRYGYKQDIGVAFIVVKTGIRKW